MPFVGYGITYMPDRIQVKELFLRIHALPDGERDVALDTEDAPPEVIAEARELLKEHRRLTSTEMTLGLDARDIFDIHDPSDLNLGRFVIMEQIGRGGQSHVFRAHDSVLGRDVAVKVVNAGSLDDRASAGVDEARVIAKCQHSRIAVVHDVIETGRVAAIAMQHCPKGTLSDRINSPRLTERLLDIAHICDAVEAAHQHGVLHLDIKPSNILYDAEDRAVLSDFGASFVQSKDGASSSAGTLAYAAPERLRNETPTAASDIYSLGVVLYEICTRKLPVDGTVSEIRSQIEAGRIARLKRVRGRISRDLEVIVNKCLDRNPEHRYQSAGVLAAELREAVGGRPILARPPSVVRKMVLFAKRRRALTASVGMAVSGLVAIGLAIPALTKATLIVDVAAGTTADVWELNSEGSHHFVGSTPLRSLVEPEEPIQLLLFRNGDWAEARVHPVRGRVTEVRAMIRETSSVVSDMVLVPAHANGPAFYLDEDEVTNGEYRAFVDATGHTPPPIWPDGELPPSWQSLPVVGVTHSDATAFAMWAGKRLPTVAELRRSSMESDLELPMTSTLSRKGGLRRVEDLNPDDLTEYIQSNTRSSRPTSGRVVNLNRGASEWTSSAFEDGSSSYFVVGHPWYLVDGLQRSGLAQMVFNAQSAYLEIGFRCAKSFVGNDLGW